MSDRLGSTGGGDPFGGWRPAHEEEVLKAQKARKTRRALLVLLAIAAVAFAAGWNPPTGSIHSFSRVSDYNAERESGCTNSGKGCHGSESAYTDFNTYHPVAKCTTCHDYQGVGCIPCHSSSKNHECEACHDGTVENVSDRTRLTDPFPRGHYRETTHTAMGTVFDREMRTAEEGAAKATCADCHSRDLRTAHTDVKPVEKSTFGETIGCGECHNDTASDGQAQVLSDWKNHDCESCHAEKSAAPMHAASIAEKVAGTGPARCGDSGPGCHAANDLHALHADAPKDCSGSARKGEPGCHDLEAEAAVPTATGCGAGSKGCHLGYQADGLGHKNNAVHSPKTGAPASDTSFFATPCGGCHRMAPDGQSLIDEHGLATSQRSRDAANGCRNCHDAPESSDAIGNSWEARDTSASCSACHGIDELPAAHEGDVPTLHTPAANSAGCAQTGPGCHPTANLSEVGAPSTTANIHRDCLRCHDWTESDGNVAYEPGATTCGSGRDCHAEKGSYEPTSSIHAGPGGRTDGTDAHHIAGSSQRDAVYTDAETGVKTACSSCHSMALGTEHARPNANLATGTGTLCVRCHDRRTVTAETVKGDWPGRGTSAACAACHGEPGVPAPHAAIDTVHDFTELAPDGTPTPGYCSRPDCHASHDVRVVHKDRGCQNGRCHRAEGDIVAKRVRSCGGIDRTIACHTGRSESEHRVDHSADLTGTVNGVTYEPGANIGCFGCHADDLRSEHTSALAGVSMEGSPANPCRVCHDGPGAGAYASLPAVKAAIEDRDHRCIACHRSGSALDGPTAVASPHMAISLDTTLLPAGAVWSDPFGDWKSAFDAVTGGGHNVLSADLVGGARAKSFPVTTYTIDAQTYRWALPANSGRTTWLKPSVFGTSSVDTTANIQHVTITCEDCHRFPDGAAGPQGASVRVRMDPEYSQTEFANPSFGMNQWMATGTERVICYKCHAVYVGGVEGTTTVGGATLHNSHRAHTRYDPLTNPQYYGDKCIDCHVRIPHAWKRPRLLVRTIVTTDGVAPDAYPYVLPGDRKGLLGVKLGDFSDPSKLTRASCVTGGCYSSHSTTSHPLPEEAPGSAYWP